MRRFQSCSLSRLAWALLLLGGPLAPASPPLPISFERWTVVQYGRWEQGPARWVLKDRDTKAIQVLNADASILLSDFNVDHQELHGTWRVTDLTDNDLMGFAFGFVDDLHFYLFDWKNEDQSGPNRGVAFQGMTVKRVQLDGPPSPLDLWPTFPPDTNHVVTLYHNDLPWHSFVDYQFTFEAFPGLFVITVQQEAQTLAQFQIEDNLFPIGRFGLYNSSQQDVEYRAFTRRAVPALPVLRVQDVTLAEGNDDSVQALFNLTLSEPYLANPVSLTVATADDTALAGRDYQSFPLTRVVFEPGQTQQIVSVPIVGDDISEPDEDFRLELSEPIRLRLERSWALGRILNDDTLANQPPTAIITSPQDMDRFPAPAQLLLTAEASDPDGTVEAVDFYNGDAWLGRSLTQPFQLFWSNQAAGQYTLSVRAVDNHGAQGTSAPVQIFLDQGDVYADVAIVRNFQSNEINQLVLYLAEINLTADLFDQAGLSSEILRHYRLVVWDDAGPDGLEEATTEILEQIYSDGIPIYLIGERLTRAVAEFPETARDRWYEFMHARPSLGPGGHGVLESLISHPVTDGPFGAIISFPYSEILEPIQATGQGELLLSRSADTEVLLAQEDPNTTTRALVQDFLVWTRSNACSQVERKRLFKNAVWWLIKNPPLPRFLNLFLGGSVSESPVTQGSPYTLEVTVVHNGELAATEVTLSYYLPTEVTYMNSAPSQGECVNACGVVTCHLGELSQSAEASVMFTVVPTGAGALTNTLTVSSSEGEARTVDNILMLPIEVLSPSLIQLALVPSSSSSLQLWLDGPSGTYCIETSSNLIDWLSWTNLSKTSEPAWLELPPLLESSSQFFRARQAP